MRRKKQGDRISKVLLYYDKKLKPSLTGIEYSPDVCSNLVRNLLQRSLTYHDVLSSGDSIHFHCLCPNSPKKYIPFKFEDLKVIEFESNDPRHKLWCMMMEKIGKEGVTESELRSN